MFTRDELDAIVRNPSAIAPARTVRPRVLKADATIVNACPRALAYDRAHTDMRNKVVSETAQSIDNAFAQRQLARKGEWLALPANRARLNAHPTSTI